MYIAERITGLEDTLDSREIIARLEDLEEEHAEGRLDLSEVAELKMLRHVHAEGYNIDDWEHGRTLIRETYTENYAAEFADSLGFTSSQQWPFNHIDWAAAATELTSSMTTVEFPDGTVYFVH